MNKIFDIWWGFTVIAGGIAYANAKCLLRMFDEG
jgi:hypothetical protein